MAEDGLVGCYGVDGNLAEGMIFLLGIMFLQALVLFELMKRGFRY